MEKEAKIPYYDSLFEKEGKGTKQKTTFIKKIFKKDFLKIFFSTILYIIKASPVWIIPVITSDVINIITDLPDDYVKRLIVDGVFITILVIQNAFTHVWYAKIVDKMIRKTGNGVRLTVIRKLQHLSITYHKEMETGTIQSKFLTDIDRIDSYYSTIIKVIIPGIIGVLVSCAISLYNSVIVSLFFLIIIPINLLINQFYRKKLRNSNRSYRIENEAMAARLNNMLQMLTLIKSHGLETVETVQTKKAIDKVTQEGLKVDKELANLGSMNWVISTTLSIISLFFTAYLAIIGKISVGEVVLFQSLFGGISGSVTSLINAFPTLVAGNESILSVSEIIESDDLENRDGNKEPKNVIGYVDFNNVNYKYPDSNEYQIKNFDLHVRKGECIAFVGSSGSGKSTIMNLLLGLIDPTEGSVEIDGNNLLDLSKTTYRHFVSVVPQNCILFPGSIRDNITYGLETYNEQDLEKVIKAANIDEFLPSMKHGIDTSVGEHGDKLSGGQKQRVSIARALIRNPKILILDEATSALDNFSEYHIEKAIEAMTKTCTTFIVAHRLSTIRNADRIVVMENGEAVEIGTYKELIDKKGRFYELDQLSKLEEKIK